jgi:hypothetical protein
LEITADSLEYLEGRSDELEELISSYFDEGELVRFNCDIFEGTGEEDEENPDVYDDDRFEEYEEYEDDEFEE